MRQLPLASIVGVAIFLLFSCRSTEVDMSVRYPNMVANLDPIAIGSVNAEMDKLLNTQVKAYNIKVVFHPRLNSVMLEFRYEFVTYRQYWDEASRKHFIGALEIYKADYEARKLVDRYSKTRATYGKIQGRLEWEAFKLTKTRLSYPVIDIGYRFRSKMPYFSTHMRTAREVYEAGDTDTREGSDQIILYFTRAQADDLAKFFDQSYLMGAISGMESKTTSIVETDVYTEFEN
jgi:hypothetical protein